MTALFGARDRLREAAIHRRLPTAAFCGGGAAVQFFGMWGLVFTVHRTLGWTCQLMRGKINRHSRLPTSRVPMRGADGGPASHALPGTPMAISPGAAPPSTVGEKAA